MSIQKYLSKIAEEMKISFTLNDKFISFEEVFKDTGMLPALARRADQLCSLCLGYGIGVSFDEISEAKLGVRVIFDDITPNILRLMCIVDVIYELKKSSSSHDKIALDELMYD